MGNSCEWVCLVGVKDGFIEGCKHYFYTQKDAEKFRKFISKQPTVEWTQVCKSEEVD